MMVEQKDALPEELLPNNRPFLELQKYSRNIRYTMGNLSASRNRCTLDLPNEDCMSLNGNLRFTAVVSNMGASSECSPEFLGHSFIDRMILSIGGSTIIDISHYNLFQNIVNVATDPNKSQGDRAFNSMSHSSQMDVETRKTMTTFDYNIPLSLLKGSLLEHGKTLLPLFMLPKVSLTLYFASNESCLSSVGGAATYEITNLEYVTSFYTSPAIKSYYQSVPYALSFTDCSHRTYTLREGESQFDLQVPSNFRSLRSVVAVARSSNIDTDYSSSNKFITYDPLGGPGTTWNLSVNGFRVFQQDIKGRDQFHGQLRRCFGDGVLESKFFEAGTEFSGDKAIFCGQLETMGGSSDWVSGARTNTHVSSLVIHITTDTPLEENKQLDCFLLHDKMLSINGGRLQVIF
jgi:hypothetical protein